MKDRLEDFSDYLAHIGLSKNSIRNYRVDFSQLHRFLQDHYGSYLRLDAVPDQTYDVFLAHMERDGTDDARMRRYRAMIKHVQAMIASPSDGEYVRLTGVGPPVTGHQDEEKLSHDSTARNGFWHGARARVFAGGFGASALAAFLFIYGNTLSNLPLISRISSFYAIESYKNNTKNESFEIAAQRDAVLAARTTDTLLELQTDAQVQGLLEVLGGINTQGAEIDLGGGPLVNASNVTTDAISIAGTITEQNIIYGMTAGDGIAISAGQTPTISSTQVAFGSVTVGGSTVLADAVADTFTLAGSGSVSISASGDVITISGTDSDSDTDTTYTAGTDIDLSGTTFSLETTIDSVTTINFGASGSGIILADGAFLDLSAITHDDSAEQGIKLPQAASFSNLSDTDGGYLVWDSDDGKLQQWDGTQWEDIATGGSTVWTDAGSYISADNATNVVVTDTGNIGIGTTNPGAELSVVGDGIVSSGLSVGFSGDGTDDRIYIGDTTFFLDFANIVASTPLLNFDTDDYLEYNRTDDRFSFFVGGTEEARVSSPGLLTNNIRDISGGNLILQDDAGNVGIGTTDPGTLLDVAGTLSVDGNVTLGDASGDAITFNADTWTLANATSVDLADGSTTALRFETNLLNFDTTNSYIGIGTTAPMTKLHVAGDLRLTGGFYDGSDSIGVNGYVLSSTGTATAWLPATSLGNWQRNGTTLSPLTITDNLSIGSTNIGLATLYIPGSSDNDAWFGLGTGNLGIGTSAPTGLLHLSIGDTSVVAQKISIEATRTANIFEINDDDGVGGGDVFLIDESGNVGIGTTSTSKQLHVLSSSGGDGIRIENTQPTLEFFDNNLAADQGLAAIDVSAGSFIFRALNDDGTTIRDLLYLRRGDNVGIATTDPQSTLHIYNGLPTLRIEDSTSNHEDLLITVDQDLAQFEEAGGAANDLFVLDLSDARVGVGTTNPGTLLDVAGTLSVDGNVTLGDASGDAITFNADTWTLANATSVDLADGSTTALRFETNLLNFDTTNSYIGIGTTAPSALLDIGNGTVNFIDGANDLLVADDVEIDDALFVGGDVTIGGTTLTASSLTTFNCTDCINWDDIASSMTLDETTSINLFNSGDLDLRFYNSDSGAELLFLDGSADNVGIGTTNPSSFKLEIGGSVGPSANDTYDLGADSLRWQDIYLGPDTLHIGTSTSDEGTLSYDTGVNDFLIDSDGDLVLQSGSGGNVGIGTTAPTGLLHLAIGATDVVAQKILVEATRTANIFEISDDDGAGGGDIFLIDDGGNIGLGTTNPSFALEIVDSDNILSEFESTDAIAGIQLTDTADTAYFLTQNSLASVGLSGSVDASNITIDTTGNLGIGTTNPQDTLSVLGTSQFQTASDSTTAFQWLDADGGTPILNIDATSELIGIGTTAPDYKLDIVSPDTTGLLDLTGDSITTGTGINVSLDGLTSGTGMLLEVDGSTSFSGDIFKINIGAGTSSPTGNLLALYDNGSELFSVDTAKITSAIPHEFTAAGDVSVANDLQFTNQSAATIKSKGPLTIESGEVFENLDLTLKPSGSGSVVIDDGSDLELYSDENLILDADDAGDTYFTFDNTNDYIRFYIDGTEAVRFLDSALANTTSIEADETISAGGDFDIAETYPTFDESLRPGDVVMIDQSDASGIPSIVTRAERDDSVQNRQVLGIVSTLPGFSMGANSFAGEYCRAVLDRGVDVVIDELKDDLTKKLLENEASASAVLELDSPESTSSATYDVVSATVEERAIAERATAEGCRAAKQVLITLAGRVPLKVSIENGDIRPGDILGISSVPGVAMRATSPGYTVAKALEPFSAEDADTDGYGVIMAYANLSYFPGEGGLAGVLGAATAIGEIGEIDPIESIAEGISYEDLNVLGETTLSDTSITGNLSVGLLKIEGVAASISAIGTELKIQSSPLSGNLNIFNGKVVMTSDGSVYVDKKISAKQFAVDVSKPESASLGSETLPAEWTRVTIKTSAVTDDSTIFVTPRTLISTPLAITNTKPGESFTVSIGQPVDIDVEFDWWVVEKDHGQEL